MCREASGRNTFQRSWRRSVHKSRLDAISLIKKPPAPRTTTLRRSKRFYRNIGPPTPSWGLLVATVLKFHRRVQCLPFSQRMLLRPSSSIVFCHQGRSQQNLINVKKEARGWYLDKAHSWTTTTIGFLYLLQLVPQHSRIADILCSELSSDEL